MQLVFDFPVFPRYSFENFVVCDGNRTALDFARRIIDPAGGEGVLYLYGSAGSGKTHLLMSIARELYPDGGDATCLFCRDFVAWASPETDTETGPLVEQYANVPVLCVDDIDLLPNTRHHRESVWHLFNEFYQSGRRIVVTGAVPPNELTSVDEHLSSRLLWGLVARMDISDDASRHRILKKLSEDRQIILPEEVIDYLLIHTRRDMHSLINTFAGLATEALASGRKISVRLAREALFRGLTA